MASRLAVELEAGRRWIEALAVARAEEARTQGALFRQQQGQGQGQEVLSSVIETTTMAPPSSPRQTAQPQQARASRSTTQIFISLDDIYLCLVNNALGVPIAYAALLGTDFRMQQQQQEGAQGSSLDLSSSVGLRAGAYY
jgi:hypothetical protein